MRGLGSIIRSPTAPVAVGMHGGVLVGWVWRGRARWPVPPYLLQVGGEIASGDEPRIQVVEALVWAWHWRREVGGVGTAGVKQK